MKFKLGDISTIKGGKRLPKGEKLQEIRNNHPYLRIVDFDGFDFNKRNLQYVPNNVFEKIQKYTISKDDIFLSIVGTIGIVALIGDELDRASLTENAVKITVSNQVNKNYLYYFLQSQLGQEQINSLSVGSTQKKLPIKNIKKIEIDLPSLAVQKGIAHKLRILDEKIKLNRKINDNLLDIAKVKWNSLDKSRKFVIADIFNLKYGNNLSKKSLLDSGTPVFGANGMIGYTNKSPTLNDFSVAITCRGNGSGDVQLMNKNIFITNNLLSISPKKHVNSWTVFEILKNTNILGAVTGSAQPQLTIKNANGIELSLPSSEKIRAFNKFTSPLEQLFWKNQSQSQVLQEFKSQLLNRYF